MKFLRRLAIENIVDRRSLLTVLLWLGFLLSASAQDAALFGKISDIEDGSMLTGANVALISTDESKQVDVSAASLSGDYRIESLNPGMYRLIVRFAGYEPRRISVRLLAGEQKQFDVRMERSGFDANRIVETSGQLGNQQPAASQSVDAVNEARLLTTIEPAGIEFLPGISGGSVSMMRYELAANGFLFPFMPGPGIRLDGEDFSFPAFEAAEYSGVEPGTQSLQTITYFPGHTNRDIQTSRDGVLSLMRRSSLNAPGVVLSVAGGNNNIRQVSFRRTGVHSRERVGYTLNASYVRANEWTLDAADSLDNRALRLDSLARVEQANKLFLNAALVVRLGRQSWLRTSAGFSSSTATVPTGMGITQLDGFQRLVGRLQLQSGGLQLSASADQIDTGDSFFYTSAANWQDKLRRLRSNLNYRRSGAKGSMHIGFSGEQTTADGSVGSQFDSTLVEGYSVLHGLVDLRRVLIGRVLEAQIGLNVERNNVTEDVLLSPMMSIRLQLSAKHQLIAGVSRNNNNATAHQLFGTSELSGLYSLADSLKPDEQKSTVDITYRGLWVDKLLISLRGYSEQHDRLIALPGSRSITANRLTVVENVKYWGLQADMRVLLAKEATLDVYGQFTSEDSFQIGSVFPEALVIALNRPALKVGSKFSWFKEKGPSLYLSAQYNGAYPYVYGVHSGEIEAAFLLNAAIGYDLSEYAKGLRIDLSGKNVLDEKQRTALGVGAAGRHILARFTLSI
ncbi:MAG: carboxypeptidase regulatory-like domain-containing protein [Calditrichia bacterium]